MNSKKEREMKDECILESELANEIVTTSELLATPVFHSFTMECSTMQHLSCLQLYHFTDSQPCSYSLPP